MTNDSHDIDAHDVDAHVRDALEAETAGVVASDALLERIHLEAGEAPGRDRSARRGAWAAAAAVVVLVAAIGIGSMGDDGEPVVAGLADSTTMAPPAVAGPSVSLTSTGIEPLVATTSELAPPENGWLAHTITITNAGDEAIEIEEPLGNELLGSEALSDGQIIVAFPGDVCEGEAPTDPDAPPATVDPDFIGRCGSSTRGLEPGEELTFMVSVQPAGEAVDGSSTLTVPIVWSEATSNEASRHEGSIVVTYTDLNLAMPSDAATTTPPSTTTSLGEDPVTTTSLLDEPPTTTSLAVDADLTRIEGTYTGTSDYTFGTRGCAEQDHRVALNITFPEGQAAYVAGLCAGIVDDLWTGTGTFTLVMPDGGKLTGDVTSVASLPTDGVPYTLTITGGSGGYEGSTGSCDVTVAVEDIGGGHQNQAGTISCQVFRA